MRDLNVNEIEQVDGGVAPLLVMWACYAIMGPVFVLGVANGVTE
jgi:lactobin A/cerein 7B family class IIb bacteriocin